MSRKLYMHTLDGKPAYFDGEQIVYAELRDHWQDDYSVCVLRTSVDQIRKDQEASRKYREKSRWDVGEYDFVIVSTQPSLIPWPC